jgi:hypothetical protein
MRRKLQGQIKRCEEQESAFRKEKQDIEAELTLNPAAWTPVITDRIEMLTRLINEEERRWVDLSQRLDSLK